MTSSKDFIAYYYLLRGLEINLKISVSYSSPYFRGRAPRAGPGRRPGAVKRENKKFLRLTRMILKDKMVCRWYAYGAQREDGMSKT